MRVILLVGGDRGRFPASNCLLVKGARGAILVDAGCNREQVERAASIADLVVYTHIHPDHITHHSLLTGLPARIPVADAPYKSLEELGKRYAPEIAPHWVEYARTVFSLSRPPEGEPYEPWEEIRAGDASIVMIPARGHTRGHHYTLAGSHLHISDVDLTRFGPWYGHPESSIDGFIADMTSALSLAEEAREVTTSHRERAFKPGELPGEIGMYAQALCRQASRVLHLLLGQAGPVAPQQLAGRGAIYRRYLPGMEVVMRFFETEIIAKLLEAMESRGDTQRLAKGYIARRRQPEGLCRSLSGLLPEPY